MRSLRAIFVALALVGTLWAGCTGGSTPSNEVSVVIPPTGTHHVTLTWEASTTPAVVYTVNKGTIPTGESAYKTGISATTWTDDDIVDGQTYWYTVSTVCVKLPGTPTGLTGTAQ